MLDESAKKFRKVSDEFFSQDETQHNTKGTHSIKFKSHLI